MITSAQDPKRASRRRANRATGAHRQSTPEQPQHRLLGLQRQVGNAAVSRILQRTPRDRPASTDAPWASKHHRSKPAPAKKAPDVHARVIKYDIIHDKTMITIASGPDQGVQVGMSGSLVQANGREVADFVIESAEGRVSRAFVDAIPDQVIANPHVVVKASSFVPESMEGKEF